MTATARTSPLSLDDQDTTSAAQKLRSALVLLASTSFEQLTGDTLKTVSDLIELGLRQTAEQLSDASARILAADRLLNAKDDELEEMRDELRDHQALIASYSARGIHLEVDWENRRYIVSHEYRREAGVFSNWHEAVNAARLLQSTFPGEPLADQAEPIQRVD